MEYIYAAMLLHKANQQITAENVTKVLTAAGVKPDDGRVKALVAALDGVDIEKAVKEAAVPAAPAAPAAEKGEAKKEEKSAEEKQKEEKQSEEKAAAGLGALFG